MKKYIFNAKLIKLSVLSLVAVGSISGITLTYHQAVPVPGIVEIASSVAVQAEPDALPSFVALPEISPAQEAAEKNPVEELIANRKLTIASPLTSSRSKTSTTVNTLKAEAVDTTKTKVETKKLAKTENLAKYDTTLNSYVLQVIKTYTIGRYPYLLNDDYNNYNGVTYNISYKDKLLLRANPSGNRASHCSGITFEVFFRAMQERNKKLGLSPDDFNGMSYDQIHDFVLDWYVADGNKATQNVAKAVEKYGIGQRITSLDNARAGDFIDLSRENNTGHSVVFIKWLRDDGGKIIGLKYWSSQASTQGISYKEEYFNLPNGKGENYGNIMTNYIFIARVSAVKDYK